MLCLGSPRHWSQTLLPILCTVPKCGSCWLLTIPYKGSSGISASAAPTGAGPGHHGSTCVLAASRCGLTSVAERAGIRLASLVLCCLGSLQWEKLCSLLLAFLWGVGKVWVGACLCSCQQHWAALLMIWVWPWPCLSSPRISCSCHCSAFPSPARALWPYTRLCERGELCCKAALVMTVFADSSKLKTEFAAVASSWSYCASIFKSQVLQRCLTEFLLWLVPMAGQAPRQRAPLSCQSPWSWVPLLRPSDVFGLSQGSSGIAGWHSSTWVSCSPAS